jgi:hypothetical protein
VISLLVIAIASLIPFIRYPVQHPTLNIANTFLTVFNNVIITALISLRLILANRYFAKVAPSNDSDRAHYHGAMSILVESAAPVALAGLAFAISELVGQGDDAPSIARTASWILFTTFVVR